MNIKYTIVYNRKHQLSKNDFASFALSSRLETVDY